MARVGWSAEQLAEKSRALPGRKAAAARLPKREELEATSRRFAVQYLLGVMNSALARDCLRAHRRSNIHLYPDDWKKLPIPDVPLSQQTPIAALYDMTPDEIRLVEESAPSSGSCAEPALDSPPFA